MADQGRRTKDEGRTTDEEGARLAAAMRRQTEGGGPPAAENGRRRPDEEPIPSAPTEDSGSPAAVVRPSSFVFRPSSAPRRASLSRETAESRVSVSLGLEGPGTAAVNTGVGFFDHMLGQLARHGGFDLEVTAQGDLEIDAHHTVEDVGITLGRALGQALGDRVGLRRMGDATVPLDEALALAAVDLSGRGYASIHLQLAGPRLGSMDSDLLRHFLESFAREARITVHVRVLAGTNDHHRAEAAFKALARALGEAVQYDPRRAGQVPSTKGVIDT